MKDKCQLSDEKNPRVFKHAKSGPESAKHKRRWDRSKCKRNKGAPHDVQMTQERRVDTYVYNSRREGDEYVQSRKKSFYVEREFRCIFCKKDYTWYLDPWPQRRSALADNSYGDWEETSRRPTRSRRQAAFRTSSGYRKPKSQ